MVSLFKSFSGNSDSLQLLRRYHLVVLFDNADECTILTQYLVFDGNFMSLLFVLFQVLYCVVSSYLREHVAFRNHDKIFLIDSDLHFSALELIQIA
jgi:hypothetical protein